MRQVIARNKLGFQLVFASLFIGSVLSVFSTGIQLLTSYERQKDDAIAVLESVKGTLVHPLEFALWTFDFDQINIILDGLIANEVITRLEVTSTTGHVWERGEMTVAPLRETYSLQHSDDNGTVRTLGTMSIEASLETVTARLWEQLWITLLTNLAKAYLAAFALLFVVHHLITRHLRRIAQYVDDTDATRGVADLRLDRPGSPWRDDLDRIVAALRNFESRAARSVHQLRDQVEERIKSEKEARDALSVRSSFIGTMSHEVRTPLNAILGFLHLIETDNDVPEKQRHYAHVATKAAQQLLNQLTNVLEVSRLDSNAVTIAARPTDLNRLSRLWRDTAEAAVHFHRKSIDVSLDVDESLDPEYMLDGARLTQIVTNLTDNAAKFTQSGQIQIRIRPAPETREGVNTHGLEISVADTGEGIKQDHRDDVFDRFTQSDAGLERHHGGSGLGLTICREIAQLMGATLTLGQSNKDGFSTRLLITFGCIVRLES